MTRLAEPELIQRLQALRAPPPDTGFELRLKDALSAEPTPVLDLRAARSWRPPRVVWWLAAALVPVGALAGVGGRLWSTPKSASVTAPAALEAATPVEHARPAARSLRPRPALPGAVAVAEPDVAASPNGPKPRLSEADATPAAPQRSRATSGVEPGTEAPRASHDVEPEEPATPMPQPTAAPLHRLDLELSGGAPVEPRGNERSVAALREAASAGRERAGGALAGTKAPSSPDGAGAPGARDGHRQGIDRAREARERAREQTQRREPIQGRSR